MRALLVIFLALVVAISSAFAAQVGTSMVDGRIVILESDGTWHFRDESQNKDANGCDVVAKFKVCLDKSRWSRLPSQGEFNAIYSQKDDEYYFGILSENRGSNDGVTYNYLQKIIINHAAEFSKKPVEEIRVFNITDDYLGVKGMRAIAYSAEVNGTPIIYFNAFQITNDTTVQLVLWTIGKNFTEKFRQLAATTIAKIDTSVD